MNKSIYSNRLRGESSPYLRQHAHNPVDWYPWCEEALLRAKKYRSARLALSGLFGVPLVRRQRCDDQD